MSSPFPGMDPYLEAPTRWPGVHGRLVVHLGDVLSEVLGEPFFVDVEKRVYILDEDDPARRLIVPDAVVSSTQPGVVHARGKGAAAERAAPEPAEESALLLMVQEDVEVGEPRLIIRDMETREVVAVIEVLSPANKVAGSRGRQEYLEKRRIVLRSSSHLVEIDLLRAGIRFPSFEPLPRGDYYAHVSRAATRPRGHVYAWGLRDRLPVLPVPLTDGVADARLDLGEALRRTYDRARYEREIDYRGPPSEPPLSPDDEAWLDVVLRDAGRR